MKGSAITGPVAKECVRFPLLPQFSFRSDFFLTWYTGRSVASYCVERGNCRMSGIVLFLSFLIFNHDINTTYTHAY